jgi:hypothetical protein
VACTADAEIRELVALVRNAVAGMMGGAKVDLGD